MYPQKLKLSKKYKTIESIRQDIILTNKADIFSITGTTELALTSVKVITFRRKKNLILEDLKKIFERYWMISSRFKNNNTIHQWSILRLAVTITMVINKHLPMKKMRVREKDVPYITTEWNAAIQKKRKLRNNLTSTKVKRAGSIRGSWETKQHVGGEELQLEIIGRNNQINWRRIPESFIIPIIMPFLSTKYMINQTSHSIFKVKSNRIRV